MPVSEIASELGVSVTTVRRACRTLKIGRYVPCSSGIVSRSSQAPFGWDIVHGQLVRNQMEWSWVEKAWNLRTQEVSLQKIANFLAEQKVPTKNGGRWFAKTVSQILKFNKGHFTGSL